jgi:hypothetical protein
MILRIPGLFGWHVLFIPSVMVAAKVAQVGIPGK